ncbi:E3 ubiquitin ligase PARAQUAT TOLERANCE 3 isoform X2 [Nicotiana tabacum]|uniref:E3 ubiquitin ligase PARAQUAT TOLERANCE 3 isoform X2 n=2 Tax=Nicotiana tabacum TaxID=4097 RepID=A0A1S3X5E8_TOBAC|nr:PREDICTED: zinc finger CCCH domain-containing protein 18-like isoform X2 [Nicotiana tabacum]
MAVYFKFKSAKDYDSIAIDGHFITVGNLKEKIFESKHLGRGTDFDLVVTNAQTNEEYLDEDTLIPKNTSVLIRRVPGRPRMPIVTAPVAEPDEPQVEYQSEEAQTVKSSYLGGVSSATKYPEDLDWDEFGNDLYAIPEAMPVQSSNQVQDAPPPSKADEESKIKALIDTPALDWQSQPSDGFGAGRGYGRGPGGRMMGGRGGRGFGWGGLERKTPPPGYVCHRCKVPGHFIQHCPTNGDPNYDIKKVKPPTGIPKSMLMATPDGSYALPSGAVAVLKPNEAAFDREVEGMPSIRSVGDLPPELHCPLCKEVMKDAVLTSKCCFTSFCDKCIRDYIISKSMCICGATSILADDLLPNKTLRDTINRILESNNSSAEHGGSALQVQDMESARNLPPKIPSPSQSAASRGELLPPPPPHKEETSSKVQEIAEEGKNGSAPQQMVERGRISKVADVSEATHESVSVKEPASQGSAPLADEEVQQKHVAAEAAKKKKKKKARLPLNPAAAEMQWRAAQDHLAAENYMMSMGPSAYNPYWTGMQPGLDGFAAPYHGAMPYNPYGFGPLDVPFVPPVLPQDPFGGQGFMLPFGPPMQRDLAAEFGMGFNAGPPIMSREEFEARKADLKRKREIEIRGEREFPKDREHAREVGSGADGPPVKSKSKAIPPQSSSGRPRRPERPSPDLDHHRRPERPSPDLDHHRRPERPSPELDHRRRPERPSPDLDYHRRPERPSPDRRSRDPELPRPLSKRKYEDYDDHHHEDRHRRDHHEDRHHREYAHRSSSSHHRSESSASVKPSSTGPSEPPVVAPLKSMDKKKASVFSRISFPAEDAPAASKKRKVSSSSEVPVSSSASHRGTTSNGYHEEYKAATGSRKSAAASMDYESSDDDRHFKRRPSRYEPSPPPASVQWEEEKQEGPPPRHSKGSRERGLR